MNPLLNEPPRGGAWRRLGLWVALVALLLVALSLLVWFTLRDESASRQEEADAAASEAAGELRRELLAGANTVLALPAEPGAWFERAAAAQTRHGALLRLELRGRGGAVISELNRPGAPPLFASLGRNELSAGAGVACAWARRDAAPVFSRTFFVPLTQGHGVEVLDLCVPLSRDGQEVGFVVATFGLAALLEQALRLPSARGHELALVEGDGSRLARAGDARGRSVFVGERIVDVPGMAVQLRANSVRGEPSLIPNLATALVFGLSASLLALVFALARDVRRRAGAEQALAEALAFRKAMEDSLSTGLRARDLQGRISYVNPAFATMVGFSAEELRSEPPPYWPPEQLKDYAERRRQRMAAPPGKAGEAREGFETVFVRKSGERFPVMIYEAPLVNGQGQHAGWMSAVVDLSAQRRIEELSRQQQDRLQATARLATVGEMASLLGHELNQPLAAIASYANGSLNLLAEPAEPGQAVDPELRPMLHQALTRIAEQAERAGHVIRSVHDFVRRRERAHEAVPVQVLLEAVLPLVRLQARKSGTRVVVQLAGELPRVRCDRTMVEQVLLNLTRNGIQAMEEGIPPEQRVLTLSVASSSPRWVMFSVTDAGSGISADVAPRLFTPFFTTRSEGMGLGLSLCRTVIEQHGGQLEYQSPVVEGRGCCFRFTLAATP